MSNDLIQRHKWIIANLEDHQLQTKWSKQLGGTLDRQTLNRGHGLQLLRGVIGDGHNITLMTSGSGWRVLGINNVISDSVINHGIGYWREPQVEQYLTRFGLGAVGDIRDRERRGRTAIHSSVDEHSCCKQDDGGEHRTKYVGRCSTRSKIVIQIFIQIFIVSRFRCVGNNRYRHGVRRLRLCLATLHIGEGNYFLARAKPAQIIAQCICIAISTFC